jgi:hypothetical protein
MSRLHNSLFSWVLICEPTQQVNAREARRCFPAQMGPMRGNLVHMDWEPRCEHCVSQWSANTPLRHAASCRSTRTGNQSHSYIVPTKIRTSCRPQLFDSSRKHPDFKGFVNVRHDIVSTPGSDYLCRFHGHVDLYKAVFQVHRHWRGRKSIAA